jgi:hypothetical protein
LRLNLILKEVLRYPEVYLPGILPMIFILHLAIYLDLQLLDLQFLNISKNSEDLESVEHIIISENKIPQGIYSGTNEGRKSPTESEMSFHGFKTRE